MEFAFAGWQGTQGIRRGGHVPRASARADVRSAAASPADASRGTVKACDWRARCGCVCWLALSWDRLMSWGGPVLTESSQLDAAIEQEGIAGERPATVTPEHGLSGLRRAKCASNRSSMGARLRDQHGRSWARDLLQRVRTADVRLRSNRSRRSRPRGCDRAAVTASRTPAGLGPLSRNTRAEHSWPTGRSYSDARRRDRVSRRTDHNESRASRRRRIHRIRSRHQRAPKGRGGAALGAPQARVGRGRAGITAARCDARRSSSKARGAPCSSG